ncbi:MAG TPA: DUF6527 family protein [Rhizomicrobium sp.]
MSTTKTPRSKPDRAIVHEFVEFIPDKLAPDTVYVSIEFATAVHSCFCGCGTKVVTPINPTGWHLQFDGDTISLWPSVGNWNFRCQSHYWVRNDRVVWALPMSRAEIERGRTRDRQLRNQYFGNSPEAAIPPAAPKNKRSTMLSRLFSWLK